MKKTIPVLLIIGIVVLLNVMVQPFVLRLDFSEGKQYTLTEATRGILGNLKEPVTVTAYFSGKLPPDIGKVKKDFQDLLVEYAARSGGQLEYSFIDPQTDQQKQEAVNYGIQPLTINVREKDQVRQQQAYLGAVVKRGNLTEVIPFIEPGSSPEYPLTTAIKRLSLTSKPSIAFLYGHDEFSVNELREVVQSLSSLYDIQVLDMNQQTAIADSVKVAVMWGPKSVVPFEHLNMLDAYLNRGGHLVVGLNRVTVDMQQAVVQSVETGLESWLLNKGVRVDSSVVVDVQCGSVNVPQNLGFMQVSAQVKFPYLPLVSEFADHPVTKGISQVLLPYASPVIFTGKADGSTAFQPLMYSSERSGVFPLPHQIQIAEKTWKESDFPLSAVKLGGILSRTGTDGNQHHLVVFGDADFPTTGEGGQSVGKENVSLLVNAIDWLGDDTGLLTLRSKALGFRPIKASYLLDEANQQRQLIKWGNVLLPVVLVGLIGLLMHRRNQRIRKQRMLDHYQN